MTKKPHEVTTHHDGHGLTEQITVMAMDERGPGGAHHEYHFFNGDEEVGYLQFQKWPRNEPGSTPGVLTVAVLAALVDIQQDFDRGPYPSELGRQAGEKMKSAMKLLKRRADERAERGVLGVSAK